MDISKIYDKKYLDRIDLKKPFLEQDYITFHDLKDFFPDKITFDNILYDLSVNQARDSYRNKCQFCIEYTTKSENTRYKSFRTESLECDKPFIYQKMIEGGYGWLSSLKQYKIWE